MLLTALSFPARGPASLVQNKADWIPFAVAGITAALNLVLYGPRTSKAMVDRVHQSKCSAALAHYVARSLIQDKKPEMACGQTVRRISTDPTPEMRELNRTFSRYHAMCIHLNLISLGAMVFYGWRLALRIRVE